MNTQILGNLLKSPKKSKLSPDTIIYTVQHKYQKRAMDLGIVVLDTRPSYGHPLFALPKYIQHQSRLVSNTPEWVLDEYRRFLEQSIENQPHIWKQFVGLPMLAVADVEPVKSIAAHRMVLRAVLFDYLKDQGQCVYHGGEIYPSEYKTPDLVMYATAN